MNNLFNDIFVWVFTFFLYKVISLLRKMDRSLNHKLTDEQLEIIVANIQVKKGRKLKQEELDNLKIAYQGNIREVLANYFIKDL